MYRNPIVSLITYDHSYSALKQCEISAIQVFKLDYVILVWLGNSVPTCSHASLERVWAESPVVTASISWSLLICEVLKVEFTIISYIIV